MKIEARGKYPGVKVHLDGDEAQMFLDFVATGLEPESGIFTGKYKALKDPLVFACKLGKKVQKLIGEYPNLLGERTEEQILKALKGDAEKIESQLTAIKKGKDWKSV